MPKSASWLQLANQAQLHSLFQIWSLLAPKKQDGGGQNANWRLQSSSPQTKPALSIIYTLCFIKNVSCHLVGNIWSELFSVYKSILWLVPPELWVVFSPGKSNVAFSVKMLLSLAENWATLMECFYVTTEMEYQSSSDLHHNFLIPPNTLHPVRLWVESFPPPLDMCSRHLLTEHTDRTCVCVQFTTISSCKWAAISASPACLADWCGFPLAVSALLSLTWQKKSAFGTIMSVWGVCQVSVSQYSDFTSILLERKLHVLQLMSCSWSSNSFFYSYFVYYEWMNRYIEKYDS